MNNASGIGSNTGTSYRVASQHTASSSRAQTTSSISHPPQLHASRVKASSLDWLHHHLSHPDASVRFLSQTLLDAINNSALALGNPDSQTETNAQFGLRISAADKPSLTIVANFRPDNAGNFDLTKAAMRDSLGQTRMLPPLPTPPAESAMQTQAAEDASSDPELTTGITQSVISSASHSRIKQLTNQLVLWERKSAKNQIEAKLHTLPADQHLLLLNDLSSQMSRFPADAKASVVNNWAAFSTIHHINKALDTRTETEKRLDDQLKTARRDPAFERATESIRRMVPGEMRVATTGVFRNIHAGLLYRRVFADRRPPTEAINAIEQHLSQCNNPAMVYQALKEWQPQQ